MADRKYTVEGKFGVILSVAEYLPEENPKAIIHIFYGLGEHKKRYQHAAKWFVKQGYGVYVHDHRKHGESLDELDVLGGFTDADRFEYIVDDCHYVARSIKKLHSNIPYIVLGYGVGSVYARRYISKYSQSPSAAIFLGAMPMERGSNHQFFTLTAQIVKLFKKQAPSVYLTDKMHKLFLKKMSNPQSKYDWMMADEKELEKFTSDPLCGFPYSAKFFIELFKGLREVNTSDNIEETRNIPLLFISGKDDPVGDYGSGTKELRELYNGHGFFLLTYKLIEGYRNDMFHEKDKMTIYKQLDSWMTSIIESL